MWQQMPPDGSYGGPPGTLQEDGPFGPGSPYNAPDITPGQAPPPWMMERGPMDAPQGMNPFFSPGVRPGGNMDGDGDDDYLSLTQFDGRPNWTQVPPFELYAPPAIGTPAWDDPDNGRPGGPLYNPPPDYQPPPYLGVRPGGNMDGDGDDMTWDGSEGYQAISYTKDVKPSDFTDEDPNEGGYAPYDGMYGPYGGGGNYQSLDDIRNPFDSNARMQDPMPTYGPEPWPQGAPGPGGMDDDPDLRMLNMRTHYSVTTNGARV